MGDFFSFLFSFLFFFLSLLFIILPHTQPQAILEGHSLFVCFCFLFYLHL